MWQRRDQGFLEGLPPLLAAGGWRCDHHGRGGNLTHAERAPSSLPRCASVAAVAGAERRRPPSEALRLALDISGVAGEGVPAAVVKRAAVRHRRTPNSAAVAATHAAGRRWQAPRPTLSNVGVACGGRSRHRCRRRVTETPRRTQLLCVEGREGRSACEG